MPGSERHVLAAAALEQAVGRTTRDISVRNASAFAAGIGATRPAYFADVPLAPPSMIVALEWPLLNGAVYRGLLDAPQEVMERAVHVRQASRFHRPIVAGMEVTTTGRVVGMRQARRGAIVQVVLTTAGPDDEVVADSTFTALFLDTVLDATIERTGDAPRSAAVPAANFRAERPVPIGAAHAYTECSGIWNPIHTEAIAARRAGFAAPIVHGTWTWAVAMEQAIDWWCDGNPLRLRSWSGDFVSPVVPGRAIELSGGIRAGEGCVEVRQAGQICMRAAGTLAR